MSFKIAVTQRLYDPHGNAVFTRRSCAAQNQDIFHLCKRTTLHTDKLSIGE